MADSIFQQMGSVIKTQLDNEVTAREADVASLQTDVVALQEGGSASAFESYDILDSFSYSPATGWTGSTTYQSLMQAGGIKGNQFGFARLETNSGITDTRFRGIPFQVNPSTGAITEGTQNDFWYNSSGSGISTTWFHPHPNTGLIFIGGNNAWPGQGSHYFGYSYGWLNTNNTINTGTYSSSYYDHSNNGSISSLPTGASTGKFFSVGYYGGDSKARFRINNINSAGSLSVGSPQNLSSNTSTCYVNNVIPSPTASYQTGNDVVSLMQYRVNSSAYYMKALSADGNTSNRQVNGWDNNAVGFQMEDGSVIVYSVSYGTVKYTSYNGYTTLATNPFTGLTGAFKFDSAVGIGNHQFLITSNTSGFNADYAIMRIQINPTTGEITIKSIKQLVNIIKYYSSYSGFRPIWDPAANGGSGDYTKLLLFKKNSNYCIAEVINMPPDLKPE